MTIIGPLVMAAPAEFRISDETFAKLEHAGQVSLSGEVRQQLVDLGHFWQSQLLALQSPRPKQFRKRLELIGQTLEQARAALDLNREGTTQWEYHLFNWAPNTGVEGAKDFFENVDELLKRMRAMIDLVSRLDRALPKDEGRRRPYDDERLLRILADLYEQIGGKAVAYRSEHSDDGGTAKTLFRAFAQAFYALLPVKSKRTKAGLDEALRTALRARRLKRPKRSLLVGKN